MSEYVCYAGLVNSASSLTDRPTQPFCLVSEIGATLLKYITDVFHTQG